MEEKSCRKIANVKIDSNLDYPHLPTLRLLRLLTDYTMFIFQPIKTGFPFFSSSFSWKRKNFDSDKLRFYLSDKSSGKNEILRSHKAEKRRKSQENEM